MTEYWVSQGNKWCDHCKIYIANNPLSIRTHEFGQRHKDNVAKRLASMRKENAAKEKEKQQAIRALEQIEAKAKRSYQKDLAAIKEAEVTHADKYDTGKAQLGDDGQVPSASVDSLELKQGSGSASEKMSAEWEYDESSGYYFNGATRYYYDPNSGFYYNDILGKWVTQEEAFNSSQVLISKVAANNSHSTVRSGPSANQLASINTSTMLPATFKANTNTEENIAVKRTSALPPGPLLPTSKVPLRSAKGAPSSIQVAKRKREEKTGPVSSEEAAAIAAREAAKKRTEEREKPLLGLYKAY